MVEATPSNASLLACGRALSGRGALEAPPEGSPAVSLASRRCGYDRAAMVERFQDRDLLLSQLPAAAPAASLFLEFEALRCLKLGSRHYAGIEASANAHHKGDGRTALFWQLLSRSAAARDTLGVSQTAQDSLIAALDNQRSFGQSLLPLLAAWRANGSLETARDAAGAGMSSEAEVRSGEGRFSGQAHPVFRRLNQAYAVLDRSGDVIVDASAEVDDVLFADLRRRLDAILPARRQLTERLSRRLQRRLQGARRPRWEFDLDEGYVDSSRLTRIATRPGSSLLYRQERQSENAQTAVTLLLDLSGSMRGAPVLHAAFAANALAEALERCRVPLEILGYTTRHWKDDALPPWHRSGGTPNPGRLNGIAHVVFKAAHRPWRRSKRNLAWILNEERMRENIDGEAVQWAASRLLKRPETRRVLVVLADGTPHDEATIAANGAGFLEQHLSAVTGRLERLSGFTLFGLGLGRDLSRFYTRSAVIWRPEDIGPVLLENLTSVLIG